MILCVIYEDRPRMMRLRQYLERLNQPAPSAVPESQLMSILDIKGLLHGLLSAVDKCHKLAVIHRGLSPDNMLISFSPYQVCLSDLRSGKYMPVVQSLVPYDFESDEDREFGDFTPPGEVFRGYPMYLAPEMLMEAITYSLAVDMWSVAMIFAEMVNGKALVERARTGTGQLYAIFCVLELPSVCERSRIPGVQDFPWNDYKNIPVVPTNPLTALVPRLSPEGVDLLSKMLQFVPSNRISAQEALRHPFFKKMPHQGFK